MVTKRRPHQKDELQINNPERHKVNVRCLLQEFSDFRKSKPKTKIMASGPNTSWEIDGETVETVSDFILGGSKITADGECSHEIKRCLKEKHPWKKSYDQLR